MVDELTPDEDDSRALIAELARLGLVEARVQGDGGIAYELTPAGRRLERMLTRAGVDARAVLYGRKGRPPPSAVPHGPSTRRRHLARPPGIGRLPAAGSRTRLRRLATRQGR